MPDWIARHAAAIAARAERELEALVAVSSPSGDVHGAEEVAAVAAALAPGEASVERPPCSSPDHAPDLLLRLTGTGERRLLLVGHLDTVVAHEDHQPLRREDGRLVGSGTIDMKGGDVLALGVLRALVERGDELAEAALLLVCDEEWRIGPFAHVDRFAGYDACLCFEAGQTAADGRAVAACHDPAGPQRLTAVPTVLHAGEAFNVVPDAGALICDVRADSSDAFASVLAAVPEEVSGARLQAALVREWPGMDSRRATAGLLERASAAIGRPIAAGARGGASDAAHFAASIPWTVDGLGPLGGGAHAPHEHVTAASLAPRAEVALALADAVLDGG